MQQIGRGLGIFLIATLAACSSGGGSKGVVVGTVKSTTGTPLSDAKVTLGDVTVNTNNQGYFVLGEVPADQNLVLAITADNYARSTKVVMARKGRSTFADVRMLAATETTISAAGGTATNGGASVTFPANAFGTSDDVTVQFAVLNADDNTALAAFPGDFVTNAGDTIETFGAVAIEATDSAGEPVNLAASATVQIPVPAGSPATIPLWYLDEATGQWVQEGALTGCDDGLCDGTIPHLSWWNADQVIETTCLNVCVENDEGGPAVGVQVQATGVDYNGTSSGVTDTTGCVCLAVKRDATVSVIGVTSGGVTDPTTVDTAATAAQCGGADCAALPAPLVVTPPQFQATLVWGETPTDLDSHITGPCDPDDALCTAQTTQRFHVYYSNRGSLSASPWAYLDTDDTSSFGPEVTTISKCFPGVYRYSIHNYSGSPDMATSEANIMILLPSGDIEQIAIPTSNPNSSIVWVVGDLDCGESTGGDCNCSWTTQNFFGDTTNYNP
jgi:hypothetical protein